MHEVMKQWTTKAGLEAVILYVNESHNCGYVELPEKLKGYDFTGFNGDGKWIHVHVYGGIIYQDELPEFDNKYVVGFDCAQAGDKTSYTPNGIYRSVDFCDKECEELAGQLLALLHGNDDEEDDANQDKSGAVQQGDDKMDNEDLIYKSAYTTCYVALKNGDSGLVGFNPYSMTLSYEEYIKWDKGVENALFDYAEEVAKVSKSEVDESNAKVRVSKNGSVYIPSEEIAMLPEVQEMQKQAEQIVQDSSRNYKQSDITLRDHFAGQVLLGELSNENGFGNPVNLASYAYSVADAMLKIRNE